MAKRIRNIGIIAHVDAGKTTTTERVIYFGGSKHKSGDVDEGSTTTDFDPLEKAKGITIASAAVTLEWRDAFITIIDTPGHVDFTAEVERSLRVLDGGVCVFCAVGGVEVQTEKVWFQANRHKVPRIAFVNKLDRMGADFEDCIEQMQYRLGVTPAVCTVPAGQGSEFQGVIDVIRMQFWQQDKSDPEHMKYSWVDIPEPYKEYAAKYREQLLETVSMADEEMMEMLLEGEEISQERIRAAIRAGTLRNMFTPIFCGSAKEFHGVRLLLDGVTDYLPAPDEVPPVVGIVPKTKEQEKRPPDPKAPLAALAFKTVGEKHGDLVYTRVYSGELKSGEPILNATTGKTERISHIYRLMGDRRDRLEAAKPGEIVGVVGLKNITTGATLCSPDKPILLEEISFPEPVISQALIPDKKTNESKLADALAKMVRDDPTLRCETDNETNQIILSGMGELHLEVAVHKLLRDFGVEVGVGKPMVSYRQTFSRPLELETRYIKQSGGRGKYAVIKMQYEPLDKGTIEELVEQAEEEGTKLDPNNIFFEDKIFGGAVPTEYIPSVEQGFREGCKKGAKYGYQVVDLKATLIDGKAHEVDSSQDAFKLAAIDSLREAQTKAGITLLEPIMKVVVNAPGEYQGDLARDISRRRGEILDFQFDDDKGTQRCRIHSHIPLAELFGYISDLNNFTSGKATFSMEPSHYAPVKEELADVKPKD